MPDDREWSDDDVRGLLTAWAAALESGDYARTTRVLRSGDAYCCLGVLCDVAIERGLLAAEWADPVTEAERGLVCRPGKSDGKVLRLLAGDGPSVATTYLPAALAEHLPIDETGCKKAGDPRWTGLVAPSQTDADGVAGSRSCCELASANDAGADFAAIARAIRADLLGETVTVEAAS